MYYKCIWVRILFFVQFIFLLSIGYVSYRIYVMYVSFIDLVYTDEIYQEIYSFPIQSPLGTELPALKRAKIE